MFIFIFCLHCSNWDKPSSVWQRKRKWPFRCRLEMLELTTTFVFFFKFKWGRQIAHNAMELGRILQHEQQLNKHQHFQWKWNLLAGLVSSSVLHLPQPVGYFLHLLGWWRPEPPCCVSSLAHLKILILTNLTLFYTASSQLANQTARLVHCRYLQCS